MGYVDYPLIVDPEQLVQQALAQLRAATGAPLNETHPLVALLEAVIYRNAETRVITADVARAIYRDHGRKIYGIVPVEAASATAESTWTAADDAGYTIPAGTLVTYATSGDRRIALRTLEETVIPPGSTQATGVELEAVIVGSHANGLATGPVAVVEQFATTFTVVTTTVTAGGVDAESDAEYVDRLTAEIRAASTGGLVLPLDYETAARRVAGVHRALVIDLYAPGRVLTDAATTNTDATVTSATGAFTDADIGRSVTGTGIPGGATIASVNSATSIELSAAATATAAGVMLSLGPLTDQERTVTVAVVDEDGAAVSAPVKAEVLAELEDRREANFLFYVVDPDFTAITVDFTAVAVDGADEVAVEAAAIAAVEAYLDPGEWAGGSESPPAWRDAPVRYLELAALLNNVDGIDHLTGLTLNGGTADVTLSGVAPLPTRTVTGSVL
jgi:uncharacterized phage protein gp47/JayE